jgi:hypothetical protein
MKNTFSYLSLCLIILVISCQDKKEAVVIKDHDEVPSYVKRIDNRKLTDSLFNQAITTGDEKIYNDVAGDYILDQNYEGLLYYSLIMANKYDNPEAHFHIFLILKQSGVKGAFESVDVKTKNLALYHLIKSNELGYGSAKYSIDEIFGKGKPVQKSNYYLTEYSK